MKVILYKYKAADSHADILGEKFNYSDLPSIVSINSDNTPNCLSGCNDVRSARAFLNAQYGITDERIQSIILTLIYDEQYKISDAFSSYLRKIGLKHDDKINWLTPLPRELTIKYDPDSQLITFQLPVAYFGRQCLYEGNVVNLDETEIRDDDLNESLYMPVTTRVVGNEALKYEPLGNVSLTIHISEPNIYLDELTINLIAEAQNTPRLLAFWGEHTLDFERQENNIQIEPKNEEEAILFEFAEGLTSEDRSFLLSNESAYLTDEGVEDLDNTLSLYKTHRSKLLYEVSKLTPHEQDGVFTERVSCQRKIANVIFYNKRSDKAAAISGEILSAKCCFSRKAIRELSFASIRSMSEDEKLRRPWKIIASTVKKQTEEMKRFVGACGVIDTEVFKPYLQTLQLILAQTLLPKKISAKNRDKSLADLAKGIQLAEFEFYLAIAKDDTIPLNEILEYFGEKYQYKDLEDKLNTELPSLFAILSYVQDKGKTELNKLCDKYQRKIFSLAYQNVEQELEAGSLKIRLIGLEEQFLREVVENSDISLEDIQYFITQTQIDLGEEKPAERTELEKAIDQKGLLSEENRAQLKSDFQREKAKIKLFAKNEAAAKEMLAEKSKDFYTRVRNETKITHAKLLQEAESTIFTQAFWAYLISYSLNYDFKYQKPSDFRKNVIFVGLMLWRAVKSIVELPLLSASVFFYGMATASAKKAEENYWYNIPRVLAYGLHKFFDVGFFIARATLSPQTNKEEMTKKGKMWGYLSLSTTVFSWTAITVATLGATSITLAGVAAAVLPSVVVEAFDTELEGISEIAKEIDPVFPQENATARFTLVAQVAAGLTALAGILYGVGKKLGSYWSTSKTEVNSPVSDEIDVTTTYNKLLQALPPKAQVRAISEEADKTCCLSPITKGNRNISFLSPDSNVSIEGNFMEGISEIDLSDSVSPSGIGQNDGQSELSGSSREEASAAEWETFFTV